MEQNPGGKHGIRPVVIFIACYDILYSCLELVRGIENRKPSFAFNAISLQGEDEGPEAELTITVPSRSVMDVLTIIVAILLLVGIVQRRAYPIFIWIYYTILRLGREIIIILLYSPPSISVRLTWCLCYAAIDILMTFNLRKILTETSVRPTPSEQSLQWEDNPPTYEDAVPWRLETESEIPCRQYGSPPPYSQCV